MLICTPIVFFNSSYLILIFAAAVQSIPFIVNGLVEQKVLTITGIHYKRTRILYKLTIGVEKLVHYKRVFTITSFTINGIDCKANCKALTLSF